MEKENKKTALLILDRIDRLLSFATIKASFILTANIVLISFAIKNLIDTKMNSSKIILDYNNTLLFIAMIFAVISLIFSCIVIMANMKSKNSKNSKPSVIFFGSIAKMGFDLFNNKIKSMSETDLNNDLVEQIVILSKACKNKFMIVNISLITFLLSFAVLITTLLIEIFW